MARVTISSNNLFPGPKGQKGDTGAQGIQGPKGDTGVVAATAPVAYNSGTSTVSLNIGSSLTTSASNLIVDSTVVPYLANANTFTNSPQTINIAATGSKGLVVNGISGQTANLIEGQNNSNLNFRVTASGSVASNGSGIFGDTTTALGRITGYTLTAGTIGLVIRGAASQTANLQEWQNSSATVLAKVNSNGGITAYNFGQTGNYINYLSDISSLDGTGGTLRFNAPASYGVRITRGSNTTSPMLVVLGIASLTGDLQQWQNSAGTVLAYVSAGGAIGSAVGYTNSGNTGGYLDTTTNQPTFIQRVASTVALAVRGAASQTANLQEWQNSAGTVLANMSSGGRISVTNIWTPTVQATGGGNGAYFSLTANATTIATTLTASVVPLTIRGAASQTANLQEWQNSAGTVLARVNSDGFIKGTRVLTMNDYGGLRELNSGAFLQLYKQNAAGPNVGTDFGAIYFRDGTNAGTLKLVVRAGTAGAETTILDNIPQT